MYIEKELVFIAIKKCLEEAIQFNLDNRAGVFNIRNALDSSRTFAYLFNSQLKQITYDRYLDIQSTLGFFLLQTGGTSY